MRTAIRTRENEAGQATILVVVGLSVFLLGAAGLAVDGSHLYAQRQMAQAAADAAAQAGILSMFDGTNSVVGNTHGFSASTFTCATSDARTPCYYAQTMNGFNAATDTVTVDFPSAATVGVPTGTLSTSDPVNLLRVTVQRNVSTTLIRLLGPTVSTISASGTAAIVAVTSPVPIIVTHPTASGALSLSGTPNITICGGPRRSIQVNSTSATAFSGNGSWSVDLSHAGPPDPGDCSSGTGADFGVFGGPANKPGGINIGTATGTGHYIQPASPVKDPLASVAAPPLPAAAPAKTGLGNGVSGCPASPPKSCNLYSPGLYSTTIDVTQETAVFKPGIYYINGGGMSTGAHGGMEMATGFTDPATGWTGNVLFYNTGTGAFNIAAANSSANLVGSPTASAYKGILFFQDRSAATASNSLGGGGQMRLQGTIYLPSANQTLNLSGGSGSGTTIQGEIIVGKLGLSGNAGITMNLNPAASLVVRQIALVN